MEKKKVRATRTNGRKDSNGVFKAGHNDRSFKLVDILNRAVEADLLLKNPAIGINPIIDGKVKSEKRILCRLSSKILRMMNQR